MHECDWLSVCACMPSYMKVMAAELVARAGEGYRYRHQQMDES